MQQPEMILQTNRLQVAIGSPPSLENKQRSRMKNSDNTSMKYANEVALAC